MPHRVKARRGAAPNQNRRVTPSTGAKRTASARSRGPSCCAGPAISSLLQVEDLRGRSQVLQHPVGPGAPGLARGLGVRVLQVAEDEGPRRAGLHAGGNVVSLPADLTLLGSSLFAVRLVPMAAKVTRLGHPRRAHSDVGIEGLVQAPRPAGRAPVELDDAVRAGLHAETATDAAGENAADDPLGARAQGLDGDRKS